MKRLIITAIAGAALVGCVKSEPEPINSAPSNAKISFETPLVGKPTKVDKGPITTTTLPKNFNFFVWAWHHDAKYTEGGAASNKVYMNNVEVSHMGGESTLWQPSTEYYWPQDGFLTFAAYGPREAVQYGTFTQTLAVPGLQVTGYDLKMNAAGKLENQYDLLYTDRIYDQKAPTSVAEQGVDLNFHHALSIVVFGGGTVRSFEGSNLSYTIDKIEILGMKTKANFTQGYDAAGSAPMPAWTNHSESVNYTYFDALSPNTPESRWSVPMKGDKMTIPSTDTGRGIIVLPQSINTVDNVTLKITYSGYNTPQPTDQSRILTRVFETNFVDFMLTQNPHWVMGKRYIYYILFGDGVQPIRFKPEVDEWELDGPHNDQIEIE